MASLLLSSSQSCRAGDKELGGSTTNQDVGRSAPSRVAVGLEEIQRAVNAEVERLQASTLMLGRPDVVCVVL